VYEAEHKFTPCVELAIDIHDDEDGFLTAIPMNDNVRGSFVPGTGQKSRKKKVVKARQAGRSAESKPPEKKKPKKQKPQGCAPARGQATTHRKCYNCQLPGHLASQCKAPKTQRRDTPRPRAGQESPSPVHPDAPQTSPQTESTEEYPSDDDEEDPEYKLKLEADAIKADILCKASFAWLTKDPENALDRKVVLQSLTAIARKDKLYAKDRGIDAVQTVARLHAEGMRLGTIARNKTVEGLTYANPSSARRGMERFAHSFGKYVRLNDIAPVRGSELERLRKLEAIQPFSRDPKTHWIAWMLALLVRLLFIPVAEECFKRAGHMLPFAWADSVVALNPWDLIPTGVLVLVELSVSTNFTRTTLFCEFLIRMVVHFFISQLPLPAAVAVHVGWNVTIVVSHCIVGTSLVWLLDAFRSLALGKSRVYESVCLEEHRMASPPLDPRFVYKPGDPCCKPSFGCEQHWGIEGIAPTVYRGCTHNEVKSIEGRVGKMVPATDNEKAVNAHWKSAFQRVGHVFNFVRPVKHHMDIHTWSSNYPPAKRDRLRAMAAEGFDMPSKMVASAFIKKEIALKESIQAIPTFKDPRFI
jgi:hypothetical protein